MFASAVTDVATLVASLSTLVVAMTALMKSRENRTAIAQVHTEVKTMNGLTMGVLADNAETRRIEAKPAVDRTPADMQHLHDVPPPTEHRSDLRD